MSAPTSIRPARPDDLGPLSRALEALPLFRRYGTTATQLEESWRRAAAAGDGLLVADAPAPAGICWYLARGAFGRGAYLRTLAICDGHHGHGLGAALLEAFERETAEAPGGWFLLVSDFNDGAQRFYARHGYREVGRLPGFVVPDVAELLLWRSRR